MNKKIITIIIVIFSIANNAMSESNTLTIKQFADLLYSSPNAQILDARSPEEFAINHIKGAININLKDLDGSEIILKTLNPKYPTFTYSINNGRSATLAKRLLEKGFEKVYELPGGLGNWVGAGYSLVTITDPTQSISTEKFKVLIQTKDLVLVDFGSKFCGGCRKLIPVLDTVENNVLANFKLIRVEFDDNPELVKAEQIKALPTLKLFKNGKQVWVHNGLINYKELISILQKKGNLLVTTK